MSHTSETKDNHNDETIKEIKEDSKPQTTEINSDLREYIDICSQIKSAREDLKIITERKSELEKTISNYMTEHNIPGFNTPNGRIAFYDAKSVTPMNEGFLREKFSENNVDSKITDTILESITSKNRPSVAVKKIKVIPKKK